MKNTIKKIGLLFAVVIMAVLFVVFLVSRPIFRKLRNRRKDKKQPKSE